MPKFLTKAGEIDIAESMQSEAIDKLTAIVSLKHLKYFYDGLAESMGDYSNTIETNIITPLSSTIDDIGTKTADIGEQIKALQESMPEIAG